MAEQPTETELAEITTPAEAKAEVETIQPPEDPCHADNISVGEKFKCFFKAPRQCDDTAQMDWFDRTKCFFKKWWPVVSVTLIVTLLIVVIVVSILLGRSQERRDNLVDGIDELIRDLKADPECNCALIRLLNVDDVLS